MALHLREGTNLVDARRRLQECADQGVNLSRGSAGRPERVHVSDYLNWMAATEAQLRNMFEDLDIRGHLRTAHFWAIRNPAFQDFRIVELINTEAAEQAEWLENLNDLRRMLAERLTAAPGKPTVVDTNVLLHYQPPAQVDWLDVVGVPAVRLVLPLRVVEELDEKKYTAARSEIADRARRLLSQLWTLLGPSAGGPVEIRPGVTIEVPIDEGPRQVPLDEIFIVPVRLNECAVPRTIQHELQYIDLFPDWSAGMTRLLTMLRREVEHRRPAPALLAG